jgi:hypothetical protein
VEKMVEKSSEQFGVRISPLGKKATNENSAVS